MESRGVDEVSARVRRDSWGGGAEKQEGHQARECPGRLEKEGLTKQVYLLGQPREGPSTNPCIFGSGYWPRATWTRPCSPPLPLSGYPPAHKTEPHPTPVWTTGSPP